MIENILCPCHRLRVFIRIISTAQLHNNLKVGDKCTREDGKNGICVIARSCPTAISQIKSTRRHTLKRCGFSNEEEIICCNKATIINEPSSRISTIRKSEKACNEYARNLPADIDEQILYGEDAHLGEFPHMAALGYKSDDKTITWGRCGGSLISYRYILTAAHCVVNQENIQPSMVRMGKIDLLGNSDGVPAQDFKVDNIEVHKEYDIKTKANDIALIRLKNIVQNRSNINPSCLYANDDNPTGLIITGWGFTTHAGKNSEILQKSALLPVDHKNCNESFIRSSFSRPIFRSQLCAKSNDSVPRDTCTGDSGGPVQVYSKTDSNIYSIVGVTSFGRGCGTNLPSIYTRVSSYLDWIENIVWP